MALFGKNKSKADKNQAAIKDALLNNMPEGIIVVADSGDILYSNAVGSKALNEGLIGPIDIMDKTKKVFTCDGIEYKTSYTRTTEESGAKGIVARLENTEKEGALEKELEATNEKLENALAFKQAFLANMSHEIRTPIHAIIGFSEIIKKQSNEDSVLRQIDMIKDSSHSLLAIINDVLDLSKIESGKMELVCSNYYISYIVRDIEANYSLLASRKGIDFVMNLDSDIPCNMYGDKIRLRGALFCILNNAIKFTKEGKVEFNIKVLEKRDDTATLCFEVKDTGVGIKRNDLDIIFDSFSKFEINSDSAVEGRGLGLSIAKGYIDLMGGKIEVESEYGVGSVFRIIVDQKIIDATPLDMNIVNARKTQSNKSFKIKDYKALVVDDNPVNLTVANGLMKTYGLDVDKASGGKEAIELCKSKSYDIIFMDQMMPEVDGIMAMKTIRTISDFYKDTSKIIVLTADAMAGVRDRLLKEGFDEYISKPLELYRLESILLKFVPKDRIEETISEKKSASVVKEEKPNKFDKRKVITDFSSKLKLRKDIIAKRISEASGTTEEYLTRCENACKSANNKISILRKAKAQGDYERCAIEMHSLKTTLTSIGNVELAEKAKELEYAGKDGLISIMDIQMEELIKNYSEFMDQLKRALEEVN